MSLNREFTGDMERELYRACMLLPESCRMESEDGFLFSFPFIVRRDSKKEKKAKSAVTINWGDRYDDAKETARVITKIMWTFDIPTFNTGRSRIWRVSDEQVKTSLTFSLIGEKNELKNEFYVEVVFQKTPAPTN